MQAIILASGEGTRLHPLTAHLPKALVPIQGRPAITWILDWLLRYGIEDVIITTCHQGHRFREILGNRYQDAYISYTFGAKQVGTAGEVINLQHIVRGKTILVVYGDVLTNANLDDMRTFHEKLFYPSVTIAVHKEMDPSRCGLVFFDHNMDWKVSRFVEKSNLFSSEMVFSGFHFLDVELLRKYPPSRDFLDWGRDLFPPLVSQGYVYGWRVQGYVHDFGTMENFKKAQEMEL